MLTLPAPAKLNLYLHITAKRADGYHLLDTVFQLIDLNDTVRLQTRPDGELRLHTPIEGLANEQHLAMKAALLLKKQIIGSKHNTSISNDYGADIWVDKRIPSGAGLGGGSSDAATTLLGLNHLWKCGLSIEQLQVLGLALGADVPFFCSTLGTAHAQGIGEDLFALPTDNKGYIVVHPDCHVPTPSVFKHPALSWPSDRRVHSAFKTAFEPGLQNDLQAPAQQMAPSIKAAIDWLSTASALEGVRMSGSGSAVFAQFSSYEHAELAFAKLKAPFEPPSNWSVWVLRGLAEHPILDCLG